MLDVARKMAEFIHASHRQAVCCPATHRPSLYAASLPTSSVTLAYCLSLGARIATAW